MNRAQKREEEEKAGGVWGSDLSSCGQSEHISKGMRGRKSLPALDLRQRQREGGEKQKVETDGQSTVCTVSEKKAKIKTVVVETQHVRWTIRCSYSTSLLPKV